MEHAQRQFEQKHCSGSRRIPSTCDPPVPLHRIATVMEQEGVSSRTLANRLGKTVTTVRNESRPSFDMLLSDLYRWRSALGVPVTELLTESDHTLSSPILLRAGLLRLMRTVRSIQEQSTEDSIQRLARRLSEKLVEMMPELKDVSAWPMLGQCRKSNELGAVFYNIVSAPHLNAHIEEE